MANDQLDSGTAYNDLLERVNRLSNQVIELSDRIKRLEDRANNEDFAKSLGRQLHPPDVK